MYDTRMFYDLFLQEDTTPPVKNETKLNQDFRKVWVHLVFWTRMYLLSVVDNLEDQAVVAERVKKIPQEMIDIFKFTFSKKREEFISEEEYQNYTIKELVKVMIQTPIRISTSPVIRRKERERINKLLNKEVIL